jgi:hypothetical protein
MPQASPDHRVRRAAGLLLSAAGVVILGVDVIIGLPFLVTVLTDPESHEAQDAGMVAFFLLLPLAIVAIACLALGFPLWPTRASGVAIATALIVVAMIVGNLAGIPLLIPAIGVAIVGAAVATWFVVRDSAVGSSA